ncbi:Aste57867_21780 [Aphanomyces stellatus]|uniref:Aste57867_21780 protein n=1 Tax=Aphanomyces stellatus TaxID=120398 RepID=A0A485LJ32_9STRA|nr:hypothetical protein As57867_021711 [Aphanomyces stellatus]VFT98449.1 Aste57867_21780 [Aphanomyces stellatus]
MVLYKQVILTNLKSSPADTAKAFQEFTSFLLSKGGVVRDLSHRGHRTLGYPVDDRRWGGTFERHREAKLLVKTFETSPTTLKELEAKMKLSYPVLRFTTFKVQRDPLRDILKANEAATAAAPEPFNWKEFKATTDEATKVFEAEYIVEEDEEDLEDAPTEFDAMSKEDQDDMTEWIMKKTQTKEELEAALEGEENDEFDLAEADEADDEDEEELDEDENDDGKNDGIGTANRDITTVDLSDFDFENDMADEREVPEWKRDSAYVPDRSSLNKKD